MAEEKFKSRKFLVWITWLILSVITAIVMAVVLFLTKNIPESLVELFNRIIEYFFIISLLYLGVNMGQKGIEVLKTKVEENKAEEVPEAEVSKDGQKDFNQQ